MQAHADIAFRTALLVTGSAADAEEVAQDAFVKAYRALGRFRRGAPFRPWLLQIVVNEARNRRRSTGRRELLTLRVADEGSSGGAAPSPEAELLAAEQRRRLLVAVADLREDERLVVSCRHFLGLSEDETSTALGVPRRHGQVAALAGARQVARLPRGGCGRVTELARRLDDLGTSLAFPQTPDLAPTVLARISARRRRRRAVVLALAAAAATIVTALALSPGARSAVQRLIGIGGVQIELVDELPATPVRARPDFGAEVSLAEARRLAGFRVRLPALAGLGEPDAVFFRDYPTGMVTIVYGPIDEPRLALTEWRGATVETVAIKVVPAGTTVDYVRVRGALGIWLSGAPARDLRVRSRGRRLRREPPPRRQRPRLGAPAAGLQARDGPAARGRARDRERRSDSGNVSPSRL